MDIGMVTMYLLMSVFHSAHWLRLFSSPTKRLSPVLIRRSPDRAATTDSVEKQIDAKERRRPPSSD
jgi:hypothetical protein